MLSILNYLTLSRAQIRACEQNTIDTLGISAIVLMENAGRSIVEYLLENHIQGKIVICCGKGNNGGDGLVVARYLYTRNFSIKVFLLADPTKLSPEASINYNIAKKLGIAMTHITETNLENMIISIKESNWIIDAIFGTGLQGIVNQFYQNIINAINQSQAKVLSVDIPSGLDCDTGEVLGASVQADYTLTLACYKLGFNCENAKKFLGKTVVVDIGIPFINTH